MGTALGDRRHRQCDGQPASRGGGAERKRHSFEELRPSLFRFGDEIHVRSGGQVALLDLQTQETGRERDPAWLGEKGVRVHVPYRQESTERLEAFTVEREEHAIDLMAVGMLDTLVKLALSGQKRGLREVDIRSVRTGRMLR
jgi:hypothetical protein